MGAAAGQPDPWSCLMEETVQLLPPSQEISLVASCGTPSSPSLTQSEEERLALKEGDKAQHTGQLPREGPTCNTHGLPEASNRGQ